MAKSIDNRFFRDLIASMRNGVMAIARDGTISAINEEAYRILGVRQTPGDVGRHFSELLRDHPDLLRVFASAFDLSHLPNRAELRLKPTDTVIGYTLSLVRDHRGRVYGAALFFKDLTLVEQAEERERLRDRLAALGEMAAMIAHEVKNPLASIEVMAGLLRRQVADRADLQGMLGDIISEAKMANAIVLEVLEFVRPIRLEVDRTSIARVVQDAITLAESELARRGTRLEVNVPVALPPIVGDHHQLCQLVTNLLINALEALGGRGCIRVEAHERPGHDQMHPRAVVVIVADDGPGIPAEIAERIFNPFFTTKPQGSGLGLAIVRKIVDAHDGRIDVASTPGAGTTFTVMLPVGTPGQLAF
ncbi:MAG: ATP-binding protein [Acidobacteria bacterium]|jgi:signal transduction histidine kinase|nr:ATP-binding protein [Acidobacteriota bacterium]